MVKRSALPSLVYGWAEAPGEGLLTQEGLMPFLDPSPWHRTGGAEPQGWAAGCCAFGSQECWAGCCDMNSSCVRLHEGQVWVLVRAPQTCPFSMAMRRWVLETLPGTRCLAAGLDLPVASSPAPKLRRPHPAPRRVFLSCPPGLRDSTRGLQTTGETLLA